MYQVGELKPCPFCGGEASRSMGKTNDGKDWPYIECIDCGAMADLDRMGKEIEKLRIKLGQYEEDSAELLMAYGIDPDDKVDREDLKRMLNFLIGKNRRLKEMLIEERLPNFCTGVECGCAERVAEARKKARIMLHQELEQALKE